MGLNLNMSKKVQKYIVLGALGVVATAAIGAATYFFVLSDDETATSSKTKQQSAKKDAGFDLGFDSSKTVPQPAPQQGANLSTPNAPVSQVPSPQANGNLGPSPQGTPQPVGEGKSPVVMKPDGEKDKNGTSVKQPQPVAMKPEDIKAPPTIKQQPVKSVEAPKQIVPMAQPKSSTPIQPTAQQGVAMGGESVKDPSEMTQAEYYQQMQIWNRKLTLAKKQAEYAEYMKKIRGDKGGTSTGSSSQDGKKLGGAPIDLTQMANQLSGGQQNSTMQSGKNAMQQQIMPSFAPLSVSMIMTSPNKRASIMSSSGKMFTVGEGDTFVADGVQMQVKNISPYSVTVLQGDGKKKKSVTLRLSESVEGQNYDTPAAFGQTTQQASPKPIGDLTNMPSVNMQRR